MLPKKIRLNPRKERDYFTLAKRVHTHYFTVFYQTEDFGHQIAGGGGILADTETGTGADTRATSNGGALVIVPKSISKRAVVRNKLRRQFNQAILDAINEGKIAIDNIKIAISLKPGATTLTASQMKEKIISVVEDIGNPPSRN